jgi:CubicO group peptidase (beta-lactamase class C family)
VSAYIVSRSSGIDPNHLGGAMPESLVGTLRSGARRALLLFSLSLLVLPVLPLRAPAQEVDLEALDAWIGDLMEDVPTPGLAVGIVHGDSLVFARGYGVRRIGTDERVDEHTLFAVASNSKAFTAAALGMLVEEGTLGWDDRVIDHMPGFQMWDPWVTREIRVADLLTHRSGLPTFGGDHLWIGATNGREEIISRIRYLEPVGSFRASFQYQNLMFLVAGELIPATSELSWDEMIATRIFQPLGMNESNTSVRDLAGLENVAAPHEVVQGELRAVDYDDVDGVAPAAGINSNVVDMARWMRTNLRQGEFEGRRVFAVRTAREMQRIQYPLGVSEWAAENLGRRFNGYGFGWFVSDYEGRKVVSHSGGLTGMISLQTLVPEEDLGVIVLTNYAPDAPTQAITYRILDMYLGEPQRDWNQIYLGFRRQGEERARQEEERLQELRVEGTETSLPLEAYTGTYTEPLSGDARVRLEDDHLVFDYNPRHLGDLEHWHYDVFRVTWRHPIFDMPARSFVRFELDEKGEVTGLEVTFYDPIRFKKVE